MRLLSKFALAAAVAAVPSAARATIFNTDVNLAGWQAFGDFSDPNNTSQLVPLAPGAFITGVQWIGLNFDSVGGSWRSDFVLSTNVSTNDGAAGHFWDHSPAPTLGSGGNYTGSGAFTNPSNRFNSGPFQLLPDGNLFVTVWDELDDNGGTGDEIVNAGTLRITWSDVPPPPPPPPPSTEASPGGSTGGTLAAGQVKWYHFTWGGGDFTANTEGTTLSETNDTELGIYSSTGAFIATDDDSGTGNLSLLTVAGLAAGDYYLALGGFNTTFGPTGWGVSSTSTQFGNFNLNGLNTVPEPMSLGLVSVAGMMALRRRRRD